LIAALLAISCFLTAPLAAQQPESRFQPPSFDDFVKQFFHSSPEEQAALERVQIDFRTERAFGKRSIDAYLQVLIGQRVSIERRGADHRYLETLVQRVQPLMKQNRRYRKISVYVARSGRFDARSFPGGHLVFHDGVFDWAESEAALVGIVAHELSHLDRGHQLRSLKQLQLLQSTFRRPASLSPETMFKNMKSMGKDFHPFHPADEALADLDSVAWTLRLGYDVRETIHLFARLTAENQRNGSLPSAVPSFLRTQPLNAERAAAVQSKYQDLVAERPGVELIVGRENLQRRSAVKLP
jgi:predicted Zn-dependent protease